MSLILKDHIKKLMKGYPTVSDKYNVSGGILGGDEAVEVGTVMALTAVDGVFEPVGAETDVASIAGIALAANVKLTNTWSGEVATFVRPGEAVNLCFEGLVAVEIGAEEVAKVVPGAKVAFDAGALIVYESNEDTEIPGWFFTGCVEGDLAEIMIVK